MKPYTYMSDQCDIVNQFPFYWGGGPCLTVGLLWADMKTNY